MSENFANHPQSVTEIKSDRSQDASEWTPRDCLICLLREIDRGEVNPTGLVIAYAETIDEAERTFVNVASPNLLTTLGLLTRAVYRVQERSDSED